MMQELSNIQSPDQLVLNTEAMNSMFTLAQTMSGGIMTVPKHLQGNSSDCLAICMQSVQWGMNPFSVAQKTHIVSGKLGYESQLVNAVINAHAPLEKRLDFEFFGDWEKVIGKFTLATSAKGNEYTKPSWSPQDEEGLGVKVIARIKGEPEPRVVTVLLKQCHPRNSTLWATDPQQQIIYAATQKTARRLFPDVILGVYSVDELEAVNDVPKEKEINPSPTPAPESRTAGIKAKLEAQPVAEEEVPPIALDVLLSNIAAATEEADCVMIANEVRRWPKESVERKQLTQALKDKKAVMTAPAN